MRRPRTAPTLLAAGGLLTLAAAAMNASERLVWNVTASAPTGLYWVARDGASAVGDYLVVRPPPALADWLAQQGYLPKGALLVKRLAAGSPSVVCRTGSVVTIDGVVAARAEPFDHAGRALPHWRGCHTLTPHRLFLLNPAAGSLDGRYFGPLDAGTVVGRAVPLRLSGARHDL